MSKNKGFTLIELLVVIAIIGILSGIVLTSLGTARNKAKDASIKSELSSMRSQAEIFYDSNSQSYGTNTDCTTNTTGLFMDATNGVKNLKDKIEADNGTTNAVSCSSNDTNWAASSPLVTDSAKHFCVDSNGKAKEQAAAASGSACL